MRFKSNCVDLKHHWRGGIPLTVRLMRMVPGA